MLAESLEQIYDDQFVETCAEWVAPYIGDLIGYRTLHGVVPRVASPRAEVANTIRYRRRKGTVSMLEQLARDVTGWPARAVEFFELLVATQYMNHIRRHAAATADLRDALRLELGGPYQAGAFDSLRAHGRDAARRRAAPAATTSRTSGSSSGGSRRSSSRARRSWRRTATERRYRFDPLGTDQPLFISPRTEEEITHLAEPLDVPLPLTRRLLKAAARPALRRRRLAAARASRPRAGLDDGRRRPTSASATSPTTRPARPARGRTSRSPATRTSRSTRCSGGSPSPRRRRPGEERLATFHYGSALAAGGGGYDRAASLDDDRAPS